LFQESFLFSRQQVRFTTGTADNDGVLIYMHGELALFLVRLEDWSHGQSRGRWLVKAGFGSYSDGGTGLFDSPERAEEWIAYRHGLLNRA